MNLSAHIIINRGTFTLNAALEVAAGQTVAIVGPNGAGKTTLLRALAGLTPLTDGHITLGDRVLDDPAANVFIQPEDRPISVLFQGLLLFPHLSALDNIAFGLRRRGQRRAEARATAARWLTTFGLADKSKSRPHQLSGGQAQRVALARALAPHPELLLLDEPLSALDVGTRTDVRRDLTHALAAFPGVRLIITHDPTEALTLADHLLILEHGHVVQAGTPEQITAQPRSAYVARFVGVNLLRGHADHHHITVTGGLELTTSEQNVTGDAYALIQPQAISLHLCPPNGSPRNVWPGHVQALDRNGHTVRVAVDSKPPVVAEITPAAASELALTPGTPVWVSVKATEVLTYPA